ncbi:hypothetical protein IAT38_003357 [Cryptococcus sp. DSM 104549]
MSPQETLPPSHAHLAPRRPTQVQPAKRHLIARQTVFTDVPKIQVIPTYIQNPVCQIRPAFQYVRADRTTRSTAPSPSTNSSTPSARFPFPFNLNPSSSSPSSSTSTPCAPTAQAAQLTITSLQNEVIVLRKALKYDTEDSRGRLEVLIKQWRAAGRGTVERLFGITPQPLDSPFGPTPASSSADAYLFSNPTQGYSRSPFWDDLPTSSS